MFPSLGPLSIPRFPSLGPMFSSLRPPAHPALPLSRLPLACPTHASRSLKSSVSQPSNQCSRLLHLDTNCRLAPRNPKPPPYSQHGTAHTQSDKTHKLHCRLPARPRTPQPLHPTYCQNAAQPACRSIRHCNGGQSSDASPGDVGAAAPAVGPEAPAAQLPSAAAAGCSLQQR